ncbi:MAG: hypothetical protein ACREP7_09610, partial [Lysobacter sp.]
VESDPDPDPDPDPENSVTTYRHSRASRLRRTSAEPNIQQLSPVPSTERRPREGGDPGPFVRERLKSLDSRVRGNDGVEG